MEIADLAVELLLIALVLFALLATAIGQLQGAEGIRRDGLPPGRAAPRWMLPDMAGRQRRTPSERQWQMLVFADHSLASFPDLVAGMNNVASLQPDLEVLLSRDGVALCEATVRALGLHVPIVRVDQALYDCFRVRVMPFVFLLDTRRTIHWVGLVNTAEQLVHAWRMVEAATFADRHVRMVPV